MVSALAFDAFGTLITYGAIRKNPYQRLLESTTDGSVGRRPFLTRNVTVDVFAHELGLSHLVPVVRSEPAAEIQGLELFTEVGSVFQKLRAAGIPIAVCSNLAFEYGAVVRKLPPKLVAYVLSYEVSAAKPEPEIYAQVCKALARSPREVLLIGDSKRCDFDGLQVFGMQARLVDHASGQTLFDVLGDVL